MQKSNFKIKIILFIALAISLLFFSSNFDSVDIKKTAIITAVAIDIEEGEYKVTAQVAVPEATNSNTENAKAEIYGKGSTVGDAIKDIGDTSGWFPQLTFCNLIILGDSTLNLNCMKLLDYFANTLRVQDSAVVVLCEGKGAEVLTASTPLDHISAFALQKILLKSPGFDSDTARNDIKDFSIGYYKDSSSSFMPIVKINKVENPKPEGEGASNNEEQSSGGNSGGGSQNGVNGKGDYMFDVTQTALYKNGKYVGKLSTEQTLAFNAINGEIDGTTFELEDVQFEDQSLNGNYLITVISKKSKMQVNADNGGVNLKINLDIFCKITSQDTEKSDATASKNEPLPQEIISKAQKKFTDLLNELIQIEKTTSCDFLKVQDKIYQYNNKYYSLYKNDFYEKLVPTLTVNVYGQK